MDVAEVWSEVLSTADYQMAHQSKPIPQISSILINIISSCAKNCLISEEKNKYI